MVIRMRHTKAHTANRRSHHALKSTQFVLCKDCGHPKNKHQMCSNCGKYKGREVVNVNLKTEKKAEKLKKKKVEAGG